jgi:type I restriction enzyme S subunit
VTARELVETGVEWLGRLPNAWGVVPLSRECWVRARLGWKGLKADEYVDSGGFPMLSTPDIKGQDIDFRSAARITKARFDESPEIMLQVGDVLLTKDGSTIGTANIVRDLPEPTTLNGSIALLTPSKNLDGRYLYYVIVSQYAQAVFDRLRGGAGVPHLFQRDINRIRIPLPPLDEQRAIADYLDHETAQIDALVGKQKEFIGLLRERRRRGVPSTLARATSVDQVPDKLHRRTRMGNGSTPRSGEDRYWLDGDVSWVNSSVVNSPEVYEPARLVTQAAVRECHLPMVKPGSLLVALTGEGKTRGAATILRISSTINQHLAFIEPDDRYWVPEYLLWLMRSKYEHLRRISSENGATKGGLTVGDLRALRVSMPDLQEQCRLVKELDEATSRIDALVAKAEEHIALAKERRSALITAAVTGQIDVRAAAQKAS